MKKDTQVIQLVPFSDLKKAAKVALSTSKKQSDDHIAALQAANAKRREAKKKP